MAAILFPELQFSDSTGAPLASGTIETYIAGTSTPTPTYTDSGGGTSVGNSVPLDANGRPNSGNGIWLGSTVVYKFIIKNSSGSTIQTIDNISSGGFNGSSSFITAVAESGLTSSRYLVGAGGVLLTDGGGGSTMTLTGPDRGLNSQTGATYTVVASDWGKVIQLSTQSTSTITMTAAATLGVGFRTTILNQNTGICTVTGVGDVAASETMDIFGDGSGFVAWNRVRAANSIYTFPTHVRVGTHNVVVQTNPAQITASQNNYALATQVNVLTASAAWNITGLAVPSAITSGWSSVVYLINSSAYTLTLKHEDAASTAANRFKFSTGADIALLADQSKAFIYDNTADRWRNLV